MNIFEKGILVQLSISSWSAQKKIPEAVAVSALGTNWAKAKKSLIEPESLDKVNKIRNEARNWLRSKALPFPLNGVVFLPYTMVSQVKDQLNAYQSAFNAAVDSFVDEYPALVKLAKDTLGQHYSLNDYPPDISRYFGFSWRLVALQPPNEGLPQDLLDEERRKFEAVMEDARQVAMSALRGEFSSLVSSLVERLTPNSDGTTKKFKNSTVTNFIEFFASFSDRNVFEDADLSALIDRAKEIIAGVNPDDLRTNEVLRADIQTAMQSIQVETENLPIRKLCFD